jgi:hypothetical protein
MDPTTGLIGRTAVSELDRSLVVDERRLFADPESLGR